MLVEKEVAELDDSSVVAADANSELPESATLLSLISIACSVGGGISVVGTRGLS